VLVVQRFDRDSAGGQPFAQFFQLSEALADFRFETRRRVEVVKGDFQRLLHAPLS
jgi:hypothetical protein